MVIISWYGIDLPQPVPLNEYTGNVTAALKHGIWNPEIEMESWTQKRNTEYGNGNKRNTESNINDRKLKNFTLHNLVQSKENLF